MKTRLTIPPELDRVPHLLQVAHDTAYEIDRIFTGDDVAKLFVASLWVLFAHSCKQRLSNNPSVPCNLFSANPTPRASCDNIY